MPSPEVMNLETLLAPISEEAPSGVELKEDAAASVHYYAIKDARDTARTSERQMEMAWGEDEQVASVDPPNWGKVIEIGEAVLSQHSKDLWVTAWLTEAHCRENGFAGLRDCFRLTREICEKYFDAIHPEPDEDDGVSHTVAQWAGLNGEDSPGALVGPIRAIPITGDGSHGPLSLADFIQAQELSQLGDSDTARKRIERGAATMDVFNATVAQTSAEQFRNILEDVEQALEEFDALAAVWEEKCGDDEWGYAKAPPTSSIKSALEECRDRLKAVAKDKLATLVTAPAGGGSPDDGGESSGGESSGGQASNGGAVSAGSSNGAVALAAQGGGLSSRDEALRVLLIVADYFRCTEPHSILSHTLAQAVRWGRMSFPELMQELIEDDKARSALFQRVGVPNDGAGGQVPSADTSSGAPSSPPQAPPSAPAKEQKPSEDGW